MEREVHKFPIPAYAKRKSSRGTWRLVIEGETLTILDEDREKVERWRGEDVLAAVKGPNFWESRKVYGVYLDDQLVDLDLDYESRAALQELLDRITLASNPDMPKKAVLQGLLMMLLGAALFALGIVVTLVRFEEGRTFVWVGILVVGGSMFFLGIGKVLSRRKWLRLADRMAEEGRPTRRRRPADDDENANDV